MPLTISTHTNKPNIVPTALPSWKYSIPCLFDETTITVLCRKFGPSSCMPKLKAHNSC